ncbi:GNAT family N-acetyltransferase [uncultured Friedmanniella sp.]|uniref:GNAT family N-acetyltransferase n=1 Tax=uncultured Friedmanniella sp. TaxID=335381 RepID=UPI0035CBF421
MLRIAPVDADDDGQFAAWYSALRTGAAAGRHAPVVVSATALRSQLLHQTRAVRYAFGAFDEDRCLGTALLERDTEHNSHLGEVDVNVPPEHRRQGIGTLLLHELSEIAAEMGLTTLLGETAAVGETSPGLTFARGHGFHSVHTEDRHVLNLPLPPSRLAELARTGDAAEHGYSVSSWSGPTPADQLTALETRMNAEVPTGNVDSDPEEVTPNVLLARDHRLRERGYLSLVALVTTAGGNPAGYTQLLVHGDDPTNAVQDDTYVLTRHRGHRISAWLKSVNLAALQASSPAVRYVHSWTDGTNNAMQTINAQFGFRAVDVMHEVQRGGRQS